MKTKRLLCFLFLCLPLMAVNAQEEFVADGFTYRVLSENTAALSRVPEETEGAVTVPPTVTNGGKTYTVTQINNGEDMGAFYACAKVTAITIPATVTTIAGWLACDATACNDVTFEDGDAPLTYTSLNTEWVPYENLYLGRDLVSENPVTFFNQVKHVTVGPKVTTIPTKMFETNEQLETLDLSQATSLTTIGAYAFQSCPALTAVDMPNTVTTVGEGAFNWCTSLASVRLSESLTSIEPNTFSFCYNLEELTIPASVKSFHGTALWDINSDKHFTLTIADSDEPLTVTRDWAATIADPQSVDVYIGRDLVRTEENFSDPLFGENVTSATFGPKVKSVLPYLFYYSRNLATLTFADNSALESIGEFAFNFCTALTAINLPNTVKTIDAYAFNNAGTQIEQDEMSVWLGTSLTTIGERAFEGCSKVKNITIPASTTHIMANAFWNMYADINVTIEDSDKPLTVYYDNVYYSIFDSNATVKAYVGRNIERSGEAGNTFGSNLVSLTFGPKVTAIGDGEYKECYNLEGEVLGLTNVVSIGNRAFSQCRKMTYIELGDKLQTLGGRAFDECGLTRIDLPGTLKAIPGLYEDTGVFEQCFDLASVTLGEGIEEIGSCAFYNVLALEEITIPSTVKRIGRAAFYCNRGEGSSIKRLIIADSDMPLKFDNGTSEHSWGYGYLISNEPIDYVYLGRNVTRETTDDPLVYACNDIEIGPKVTDIGILFNHTYIGSQESVQNVKVHHVTPIAIVDDAFANDFYTKATLWVPGGTVPDYQGADGWKQFQNMQTWSYVVYFESKGNGTIAIDDMEAKGYESKLTRKPNGDTLNNSSFTVTLTPDTGYELASLTLGDLTESTAEEEIFAGRTDFTNPFVYETAINHDLSFAASFTPVIYTITYDLAGGQLPEGQENEKTYSIEYNDIVLVNPIRTGYTFTGWTGTEQSEAATAVTIAKGSTGNRTYTATWKANNYKIHFDANTGDGTMADQAFTYDEAAKALTANAFSRTGYEFTGWNTKADGSGTAYTDKQAVKNLTPEADATITLFAQWKIITYIVTIVPAENGTVEPSSFTVDYGGQLVLTVKPDENYKLKQLTVNGTDVTSQVTEEGTYTISFVTANVNVAAEFERAESCDVNNDGKVDVADIATVISVMVGHAAEFREAADTNKDNIVDVADISTIISRMSQLARLQREMEE